MCIIDNKSPFFGPLPGDGLFDFDGSGDLDSMESAVRDSEIFTYWEETEAGGTGAPDFTDDGLDDDDDDF